METEIINAKIDGTSLGPGDKGIFSCWLTLDYGGSGQGVGGYRMDAPRERELGDMGTIGTAYGMQMIVDILKAVGVDQWEDLPGQYIRVKRVAGWGGTVIAIGNMLKDNWYDFEEAAKKARDDG